MTAHVELIIGERTNAIKVPGSALRFTPDGMGNANRSGQGGFSGGQGQGAGQQGGGGGTRGMIEQLNERLSLTEEQQRTARSIFMEMGQSIRSLREGGMEVDQMGPAIAQIRQQMTEKLNALLDPEQQRLYRQMMEEADAARGTRGRVWQIGPDGKPSPVSVMIGISDSVNTEILRGEIQPGDEVIIGRSIASR
jgi:multidrug efflux pump subunit AcrA (membrane-fusion protein)